MTSRVFISYRRDDAAGYAGRLESSLERRLGRGSAFRDIEDIPPGDDFVTVIRRQLAQAHAVVVLIGPRWAGERPDAGGVRRIDDAADFVRIEVQEALDSGARVVPVLLPGAQMPAESALPDALKPLARRNAMTIGDTHWDADVDRLVAALGLAPRRRVWPLALAAAVVAAVAGYAACRWWPAAAPDDALLAGRWQAELRYHWGERYTERFEFRRHAGGWAGTATFLGYPRALENLSFDGRNLHFETRSHPTMGDESRTQTQAYAAELRGRGDNAELAFRLEIRGGFDSPTPMEFTARRAADAASAPASAPDPAPTR